MIIRTRRVLIKVIDVKKANQQNEKTTFQFAHCRRCTSRFPQYSTTGCTERSTDSVPDPGGFRKNYQTTDHLITYRLIAQQRREWCADLWVATIVFQNAFDSIEHDAIWRALRHPSISEQYVDLLKKLYGGQSATVLTDVESAKISDISWRKSRRPPEPMIVQLGAPVRGGKRYCVLEAGSTWNQAGGELEIIHLNPAIRRLRLAASRLIEPAQEDDD